MGCINSKDQLNLSIEQNSANDVEEDLMQQRLKELFKFKVLILGAGESGKSTIVKALRLIHKGKLDLTDDERERVIGTLHENVVTTIRALLEGGEKIGLSLDTDEEKQVAKSLMELDSNIISSGKFRVTPDLCHDISFLWGCPSIQAIYARRSEYWILDSCNFLMENIERFAAEDFVPTEEDLLMARVRTTGIVVNEFEMKRADIEPDEPETVSYQVVDVGGQRNERRKWIHCFDDVKAIIFTVSLVGYNQILFEDHTKKRIAEDLELFASICQRDVFKNTPLFLWLNKKDLFEKMVHADDFSNHFADYTGGKDLMAALTYITDLFKKKAPGRTLSTSYVSARVKKDIQYAFEDIKRSLYQGNKKAIDEEKNAIKQAKARISARKQKNNI